MPLLGSDSAASELLAGLAVDMSPLQCSVADTFGTEQATDPEQYELLAERPSR
jgi:hypothetical protein